MAFRATQALQDVSFQVRPGEVRALLGANGAGKSTLIKVITGVNRPDRGFLWRDGKKYLPDSPEAARRDGVHAVFQELSIFPHLSVVENIFAGTLRTMGGVVLDRGTMRRLAAAALDNLGHDIPLDTRAGDLSISNQQIVEIVRATVNGARVLLLDEPTSSLNAADRNRLFDLIRVLKSQGTAIVYISHFLAEVLQIADTYTVLRDAKVALEGNAGETSVPALSEAMFGRSVNTHFRRSGSDRGETAVKPVLNVHGLSAENVHDATFTVNAGEVLTIFGLVDCGATELLQALFGLRAVRKGAVHLPLLAAQSASAAAATGTDGPSNTQAPAKTRWSKRGIGMVPEARPAGLAMSRSIGENIAVVDWSKAGRFGLISPRRVATLAGEFIERFGIKCRGGNQPIGELSGGNQQKAALARFAITDVDVVLLSEPTRGVDIAARLELWRYIDELASAGKAIVLATTDVEEALALSNSIMVMRRGQLLPHKYDAASVTPDELMIAATGGTQ